MGLIDYAVPVRIAWNECRLRLSGMGRSHWDCGSKWGHRWEPPGTEMHCQHLMVIWAGEGRFRLRQGWVPLRPGVCIWARPGWPYVATQNPERPIRLNFLNFDLLNARGRPLPPSVPLPPEFIEPPDPEFAETVSRRIVELCYGFDPRGLADPPYPASVDARVTVMLTSLLMELDTASDRRGDDGRTPAPAPHHERMARQAILRLAENPQAPPSIAELAHQARYSVSRFSCIFRLVTGQSPETFAIHMRLRRAQRLLCETDMPVGEVALVAGYRDTGFFSRQFRQFNGLSPLHYRKQHHRTVRPLRPSADFCPPDASGSGPRSQPREPNRR